jgi:polyadenylate-binding protein
LDLYPSNHQIKVFLSYQCFIAPVESIGIAANAMHTMNGQTIGSKQIIVRLHEPKQLRQEKLAQRFSQGSPGHPRSASGATSPTQSEGGEGVIWNERTRRSSGSYYHVRISVPSKLSSIFDSGSMQAALTGNLNFPMQFDELTALSPVVRTEVLTGELSRRLKSLDHPSIPTDEVDQIVDSLVKLNLGDIVEGIHNPDRLAEQIKIARERISGSGPGDVSKTADSSPESGSGSGLLDPSLLSAPAPSSAPEHPSTPISISGSLSTPPRTSSPSGSLTASASERDRLQAAVAKLDPTLDSSKLGDITDLLLTLSKKERALCLFNAEYLRPKIADAKKVLEANDDKSGDNLTLGSTPLRPPVLSKAASAPAVPFTPKGKSNDSPFESPRTPELSSRGQSAAASPSFPPTPGLSTITSATQYTLASLAKLPAVDIIKLAESPSSSNLITGLPLPKPGPSIVQATDAYVDSLLTKPVTGQKQVLGEKL